MNDPVQRSIVYVQGIGQNDTPDQSVTVGAQRLRAYVQGIGIDAVNLTQLLDRITAYVTEDHPRQVAYVNTHCLNIAHRNAAYRAFLGRADLVYCDGMGVIWAARLLGGYLPARLTGADWIEPLAARCAADGIRLFFLGSKPGIAGRAAERLRQRFPTLQVVGTHHGHFADDATPAVIAQINQAAPDILLVGMGTPRQELWMDRHRAELHVPVTWAVGALLDFVAGKEPRAPAWMADHGLEWLFRLLVNPRRMWRRYLLGNPAFLIRVGQEWLQRQRRPC